MRAISNVIQRIKKMEYKTVVPWIWLLFGIGWSIAYQLVRGQAMLDSDMASDMVCANILNQEHSISGLANNWLYSTELGFFNISWIYRIGLVISPHNWHMARTISMAISIIIIAYGAWLVFYAVDLPRLGIWAAALTVFPGGGWYFWQTIYGGFYICYVFIILYSAALLMLSVRNLKAKRNILFVLLLILLGICAGIKGVRAIMLYYAPSEFVAFIVLCINIRMRKQQEKDFSMKDIIYDKSFHLLVISILAGIFSLIGYSINVNVFSRIYKYSHYDETKLAVSSFLEQLRNFIWNYGFTNGKTVMSVWGIASVCGVIFGMAVMISGVILITRLNRLCLEQQWLILFSVVSILFCIFIFSYVENGAINYYQPLIPLGYFLILLGINTQSTVFKESRFVLFNLTIAILAFISIATVHNETDGPCHEYRAQPEELNSIVTWLRGGYNEGMSHFWTANLITELSDGDIDMWILDRYDSDKYYDHLQKADHLTSDPSGRYFALFEKTGGEDGEYLEEYIQNFLEKHPELTEIFNDEQYVVYGTP